MSEPFQFNYNDIQKNYVIKSEFNYLTPKYLSEAIFKACPPHQNSLLLDNNTTFPQRLFQLLNTESSEIIEWLSRGRSFRINNVDRLANEILPVYFKRKLFIIKSSPSKNFLNLI
jgi:hypothetical protein